MREYVVVFLVAMAVSYLLSVVARELAVKVGAFKAVRDRDVHELPTPYFGGVAIMGGLWAGYLVATKLPFLSLAGEQAFQDARAVLGAGMVICLIGVADDVFELSALVKLGGQIAAAALMVNGGIQLYSFRIPGGGQLVLDSTIGILATIFFIVTIVNAVNFVDGLDGLAAGVTAIGAIAFGVYSYRLALINGETLAITAAMLCAAIAGGCAGFLPHNFNPSRMFMGDSGSMLLGITLAGAALTLTGQFANIQLSTGSDGGSWWASVVPLLIPIAVLLVPLADLFSAIVRRSRAGKAFYSPDQGHLHHRLMQYGHSHRGAVLVLWLWASLLAFGSVGLALYPDWRTWLIVLFGVVIAFWLTFRLRNVGAEQ